MADKQRSPNYPGLGLTEAILKAKQLYEHDGKAPVPREVAVLAWGYRGLNGASLRVLGALRQFGLIEMSSEGSVKVSGDALVLILEAEGSTDWRAALASVAMRPAIFRQLHKHYADGLPSDAAVVSYLVRTANFGEDAARTVIASYRDTLSLAGPHGAHDTPAANGSDSGDDDAAAIRDRAHSNQKPKKEAAMAESGRESLDFPFPLVTGGQAVLRVPRSMSEADHALLTSMVTSVLSGMKAALVRTVAEVDPLPEDRQRRG